VVVAVTSTVPAEPAGFVAVIWVALLTVNELALFAPNLTAVVPVRFVPVTVTEVPPASGPLVGLTDVIVGAATYVNWSLADVALVPPTVVVVMSIVPAEPEGEVAVIWVALSTVNELALVAPNLTAVAPVRFVPVIVTEVLPPVGPLVGLTDEIVGAET
jgi:hypothetical protein